MIISPKLIIFDLDGTLVEFPRHYIFAQAERILREFNHPPVPAEELEEHFSAFDFFRFMPEELRENFISRFWRAFDWDNYPKSISFPWTESVLGLIAQEETAMAIATARLDPEAEIREELESTGWLHHFRCIRNRAGEHVVWTDKTGQIRDICQTLGVSPADSILVGDIPADIASAKSAGMGGAIAVLSGGIREDVLLAAQPDVLLSGIHELPELLRLVRK